MSDRSHAPAIFTGIAPEYSWMGAIWSFGQDARWRRTMVARLNAAPGSRVLDVAAGTGLVSRELAGRKLVRVVSLDVSAPMLSAGIPVNRAAGYAERIQPVVARAEALPFPAETFDAVTFTYLLRYVDDPEAVLKELARVVRPGGGVASLEFHVPDQPALRTAWWLYTRTAMPAIGAAVSPDWFRTGRFLGPSIERFYERAPLAEQVRWWQAAGIRHVRSRVMSMGAGVVVWGVKGGPRVA